MYRVHKPSMESRLDVRVTIGRSGGVVPRIDVRRWVFARGQTTTRADDARRRDRVAMFNAFYKTFMSVRVRCARAKEDDARIGGRDDDDARVGMA